MRSSTNTNPVAGGNRAADAWAKADPRAVVIAAASADGQAALGRAADAFRDKGKADKARAIEDVAILAGVVAQMGALAGRVAQQSSTLAEEMRQGLELEGLSIPAVVKMLQTTPAGGGGTALAVLHARLPRTVAPDVTQHPHAGILPASLGGAAVRVQVSDRFDERLPELPGPGVAADGDGWLPGFDPGPGPLAKLPALDFLHAGGLEAFQRGRGAPWPLRIAYETLIDVPAAARNGGIARLEYPLRGDGDATLQAMLYPEGRLNLSRDWRRFLAALEVVDRFSVPADGGMSAWLPIRVRSVPVRTGGVLRLDVSLPPGSDKGPRILRRVLRRLGARSYPQWRAWLALAYLWDRSAVNGHWVRATRPRLARDSAGRLVDADGAVIRHTRGKQRGAPVTKWTDRRAVLLDAEGRPVPTAGEAARERNPDARLHPWLAPADIVALGYPPERGLSASALSMRKARVLEDLAAFEAEGLIAFEAHPAGRRWRVLPPDTDPA